jgi:hypothetical protein
MAKLLDWIFGRHYDSSTPKTMPPVWPTRDTQPIPPTKASTANGLPPLKNWCHPFKDTRDPLQQLTHLANATAGYYPLGRNGLWHGGVHFDGGTASILDQSSVHCLADGEVVAYRIDRESPKTTYYDHKLTVDKPFSRNFVLVRHRLQLPKIEESTDTPPSLIFYSLYMHLQDWEKYDDDPTLARPGFWSEVHRVKVTANDPHPDDPEQRGLHVYYRPRSGKVADFLPRGAEVVISGQGDYRYLKNRLGPASLSNADGSLRGYLSARYLQPQVRGEHRIETRGDELNVRPEASLRNEVISTLPNGMIVTVSGEGEFRKLERVPQYVQFAGLQSVLEPLATDQIVVLDTPVAIQAGALIGHLGDYHSEGAERPEKKLHLETFSEQDMDVFLVASRAWAQRLPASERTWLKLAKGTAVMAHRDGASATRWPVPSKTDPVSDADLLIPKSLLEGLPAEDKFSVPATSSDRKALNWYRLDGLLHDAAGNLLNGWVREDVGDTPWVSPWDWEGYEVLHDYGRPIHAMASFMRSMRHFSEAQLERYRSLADDEDQGPIRSRLFDIIDPNRDGQITADELQAALRLPAHAQAIAQMIIRKESEWFHRAHVWDVLDEMLGHSGSTPHLNWLAEKQRIKELSWWEEVADKVGLPSWGKAYHFHPVGLVGKFTSLDELKIIAGKITFCAEGNDNPTSMHYSRVIHWPGNDLSGVTLGRGYDMGSRTESEIFNHMIEAGVEDEKARRIAFAHGLKGFAARDFVANNKAVIGEITKRQQISLFNIIYPAYVDRTISIYNKWTQAEVDRVLWEDLGPVVKDVLVDFVYQGFTAGPNPMISGMRNSKTDMIFISRIHQRLASMNRAGRELTT